MAESSPRFRHDLIATAVEVDGVRYIDVHDAQRGTKFRFYDFEYDLALQLDGRPHADLSAWAIATYGLDLTPTGIAEFTARLAELGFLEKGDGDGAPSAGPAAAPARPGHAEDDSQPLSQVVSRAVGQGVLPPVDSLIPVAPVAAIRSSSSEIAVVPDPARAARSTPPDGRGSSQSSLPAVPRWMAELDTGAARTSGRREVPGDSVVGETVMGFAAVKIPPPEAASDAAEEAPDAMGTMMGFATVTDQQIRDAKKAVPGRVSSPPMGTLERRQPPTPETVVMAPFQPQPDDLRRAQPDPGIRRMAPRPSADRSTIIVVLVVATTVCAAVIGYYFWAQHQAGLESRRVRIISPRPAAVYRWFEATGSAVLAGAVDLSFAAAGSVADVLPLESRYAAGEIIAKLQGAAEREAEVNRGRSRLAYYQQIRDSMKAADNLPEMRRAEIKIVEKQALLDEAEAALDRLVIRASEPGEIDEVVAKRGTLVASNAPAVRVRIGVLRGEFGLADKDAEAAAHLGFCRIELIGLPPAGTNDQGARAGERIVADAGSAAADAPRFADCRLSGTPMSPGGKFAVELPSSDGIRLGQPMRLARIRYDGVFPVPRAAIVRIGDTDRLFVVGPGDVAQARAITIADADADEVVVSQGIDVGDRVIIDPPTDLRDGSPLTLLQ